MISGIYVAQSVFLLFPVLEEPEFTDVIQNVTVPAGRSVRLACSVKNLGSYKKRPLYLARATPGALPLGGTHCSGT
ncbi:hypothetical protein RR48_10313 [Papilio machaon]|uniref:Lachesin n=1 Tax=Papilio machaon TaxID=76193 RepID=A0A194RGZ5_PAPMA|nr:hypothetical protein RR48_10313 [Papilio machaon]